MSSPPKSGRHKSYNALNNIVLRAIAKTCEHERNFFVIVTRLRMQGIYAALEKDSPNPIYGLKKSTKEAYYSGRLPTSFGCPFLYN